MHHDHFTEPVSDGDVSEMKAAVEAALAKASGTHR